jgi:hypothetical protein
MASFTGVSAALSCSPLHCFSVAAALITARGAMRSLNTSPSFRVRCAEFAPFLVGGFYQIADSVNPGAAELAR